MPKLRCRIAMSLDGYAAGPDQGEQDPLGRGGEQLHEWAVALDAWRRAHDLEGGETNASTGVLERAQQNIGATIMGRNMFGPVRGPWTEPLWRGWWGEDPPFHVPVFVLTHHARAPEPMEGGTTFHFVTEGIEAALEQAREAAGDRDVLLAGGADVVRQYLAAGLVDELLVHLAPVLLGDGEALFDGLADAGVTLEVVDAVHAPGVTHLTYDVARAAAP